MIDGQVDLNRLCNAAQTSRLRMKVYREERAKAVRAIAGNRYSENAEKKKRFVSLAQLYISIVGRNLIAKNPRVLLSSYDTSKQAVVSAMQAWMNDEIEQTMLANTFQRIVLDALISVGIAKVSLATPTDAATHNWNQQAGKVMCERIDLDDFVVDMDARDFSDVRFIGHRFRAPLSVVQNSPLYNPRATKDLHVSDNTPFNQQGDEKIGMIGKGYNQLFMTEFEDMVDLWEIYCPGHRCVYTFADEMFAGAYPSTVDGMTVPLREQQWIGPDHGPYHILAFNIIPGQLMSKGPLLDVLDLDEVCNEAYRKLMRQVARQKDITLVQRGKTEDATAMKDAGDGDILPVEDVKAFNPISTGGANPGLFQVIREMLDRFSKMAGNLETMGGLSPQANTLGQEQLLASQSNGQIAGMQDAMQVFVSRALKASAWYWWHDPISVQRTMYAQPGVPDVSLQRKIYPAEHDDPQALKRDAAWSDLALKVDPYSYRPSTPQQKAKDIVQVMTQVFAPFMQLNQAQGVVPDMHELFEILSAYMDLPELKRVLAFMEPPESEGGPSMGPSHERTMAPETTRNYTRTSAGGNSAQAQGAEMDSMLSGMASDRFSQMSQQ